jgi:hypothetical protein
LPAAPDEAAKAGAPNAAVAPAARPERRKARRDARPLPACDGWSDIFFSDLLRNVTRILIIQYFEYVGQN